MNGEAPNAGAAEAPKAGAVEALSAGAGLDAKDSPLPNGEAAEPGAPDVCSPSPPNSPKPAHHEQALLVAVTLNPGRKMPGEVGTCD